MKAGIHPTYKKIVINCACGNSFEAGSTLSDNLRVEICSNCHPLYTGKSKLIDTAGRVDKFRARMAAAGKGMATAAIVTESAPVTTPEVTVVDEQTPLEQAEEESAMATEEMPAIEMAEENAATTETPHADEEMVADVATPEVSEEAAATEEATQTDTTDQDAETADQEEN